MSVPHTIVIDMNNVLKETKENEGNITHNETNLPSDPHTSSMGNKLSHTHTKRKSKFLKTISLTA